MKDGMRYPARRACYFCAHYPWKMYERLYGISRSEGIRQNTQISKPVEKMSTGFSIPERNDPGGRRPFFSSRSAVFCRRSPDVLKSECRKERYNESYI